jgi:hypothetical protein
MHAVNRFCLISALLATLTAPLLAAPDAEEAKPPLTMTKALKMGPEKLTEYTDESEAGQDHAANLYATAKQLETDLALAQRDLTQVAALNDWREAIAVCRLSPFSLAYIINGGGTMYSHGGSRDCAELENFLATFAKRLPLAEGKGDAKATKQLSEAIALFKKLKLPNTGDPKDMKEAEANLATEVKEAVEHWEALKGMIAVIPSQDAKAIAAFAVKTLSWLKEGEN